MFDLEQAIKDWRKRMSRAGISRGALVELEEHLRETIQRHRRAGENIERAFELATRELGEPKSLSREFSKTEDDESAGCFKATIVTITGMLLLVAALISRRHVALTPTLWIHVFSLTTAYGCVLFAGCLGIFLVLRNLFWPAVNLSPYAIRHSVELCYKIALPLVLVALLSGSIWAENTAHALWGGRREAGALMVFAWIVSALFAIQFWNPWESSIAWICLTGALITCIGWFAAGAWTPMVFSFVGVGCLLVGIWAMIQFKFFGRRALVIPDFDELTDPARRVTELAHEEAANLRHDYVGTEHLLLGIISCESGVLIDIFHKFGIDGTSIRQEVEQNVPVGYHRKLARDLPYTPRAKRALAFAAREARELGHAFVTPEHIFLGLVVETEGVAGLILRKLGFSPEQLRREILERIGPDGEGGVLPVPA